MRKLWKLSKILKVPLFDPLLKNFNEFDLVLMDFLTAFENPEILEEELRKVDNVDFDDYLEKAEQGLGADEIEEIDEETKRKIREKVLGVEVREETEDDEWEEV